MNKEIFRLEEEIGRESKIFKIAFQDFRDDIKSIRKTGYGITEWVTLEVYHANLNYYYQKRAIQNNNF